MLRIPGLDRLLRRKTVEECWDRILGSRYCIDCGTPLSSGWLSNMCPDCGKRYEDEEDAYVYSN